MARRILIHPGFHKTGTSSIQHFLWLNRARLAPVADILLLRHLQPAAKACMYFSVTQNALALTDLVDLMDTALTSHLPPGAENRDLILSCEGLSGHLPGRAHVADYAVAPVTAAYLAGYFAERLPDAQVMMVYTTRQPAPWLDSAWRHHQMTTRMTEDQATFAARMTPAADLDAMLAQVAEAVAPVPVFALPLDEAATHPQGPGGALLELLDLPGALRDSLEPVGQGNRGPDPATAARLLDLNRSSMPEAALRAEKAKLIAQTGAGGWAAPQGA